MAQAHHFLDEDRFLLLVEACEQRLGRVGDIALIHRAIVEKLGFVAHLLNDVVGRITLCARNSQVETVGAVVSEVMHRAVERGPVLLLLGRQIQFRLDPVDVKVVSAIETILAKCKSAGRRCGIHTGSIEYARNMVSKGFDFVTILGDSRILAAAAETIVRGVKASPKQDIASSTY